MRNITRESGFTLVELMVAMVIMTVGLLGMASSMATMIRSQGLSASRAEMTLLADAKLEQLRGAASVLSPDTTELKIGGSVVSPVLGYSDVIVGSTGRQYVLLWSVAAGPGSTRNVQMRVKPAVDMAQTPSKLDFSTLIVFKQ